MPQGDPLDFLFAPIDDDRSTALTADSAEPVERLLAALQPGSIAFLVRPRNNVPHAWLTQYRIERNLSLSVIELARTSVWQLLPDAWAISMEVSAEADDANDLLHVHVLCDTLRRRLLEEWLAEAEMTPYAAPQPGKAYEAAGQPLDPHSLFLVMPITAGRASEQMQENIAELNALLEVIVNRRLHTQFQPIVSLRDGQVFGYEALIRGPKGGLLRRPGDLCHAAEKARMVTWFDLACLEQIFQQASQQGIRHLLFVNMEAEGLASMDLQDRSLAMRAREHGLTPAQIVIEITERQTVGDFPRLISDIGRLREEGFKIAVDDAGAGYNSLHAIAELRPDFVKIDRNLVRNLDVNGERRALLATLVRYARQIGTAVLGEGAETREELVTLIDLGVTYCQGYLLGKPADSLRGIKHENADLIRQRARQYSRLTAGRSIAVDGLMRKGMAVGPDTPLPTVLRAFYRDESLTSVVVVEDDYVRGILMRSSLSDVLGMATSANVADLLPGETVSQWMQTAALCITPDMPLITLVRQATTRGDFSLESDIVVVNGANRYLGVLPVRVMLEALATQQAFANRYSDPLTALPNRVVLEEAVNDRLTTRQPTALVRADIDGMAIYNRARGTAHGDEVILALAALFQNVADLESDPEGLLAHLGGGDFVLLTQPERVREVCAALHSGFQSLIPQFYTAEQVRQSFVEFGKDRNGAPRRVPLCRLSVAGLTGQKHNWGNYAHALRDLHVLLRAVKQAACDYAVDMAPLESRRAA
jgi:EAL domain-containing protein (putative c-di-GMP-specific phosphodiesterase class I)/GGDEF domain-containing protein